MGHRSDHSHIPSESFNHFIHTAFWYVTCTHGPKTTVLNREGILTLHMQHTWSPFIAVIPLSMPPTCSSLVNASVPWTCILDLPLHILAIWSLIFKSQLFSSMTKKALSDTCCIGVWICQLSFVGISGN